MGGRILDGNSSKGLKGCVVFYADGVGDFMQNLPSFLISLVDTCTLMP